ncbi:MAG: hypothetical protein GTO14_04725 [Anaerolineales bacterium]|nr:hypothetical protein [Anaerolineales bacterium]
MRKNRISAMIVLLTFTLSACGPSEAELATANAQTQAVIDAQATESAGTQEARQGTQDAEATSNAATVTFEFQQASTATQAYASTATRSAQKTATQEATIVAATAEASSLYAKVRQLAADGHISTTRGTYHRLPPFNESWAQIYWYQWWYTRFSPSDFVIRADAAMDSAAPYADSASGCALVFREEDSENHYLFIVNMYGGVGLDRVYKGRMSRVGGGSYGSGSVRTEDLHFLLAVDDEKFTAFVDNEKVFTLHDTTLTSGNLALSLLSGTNRDFGTKCRMTNIELWILD